MNTYFEYLFNHGLMVTVNTEEEAKGLGFNMTVPIQTLHGGVFYIGIDREDYDAAKVIGDPAAYFITYNYLLTKQYETLLKQASQITP